MSKTKTTVKDVTNWFLSKFFTFCTICGEELLPGQKIHWDHVHCQALDGPHHHTNLRPVHAHCNLKKAGNEIRALAKIDRITGVTGNGPKRRIKSRSFGVAPEGYKHDWKSGRLVKI